MSTTIIYALIDPRSGEIRYVGKTVTSLAMRLSSHIYYANKGVHTACARWIRGLIDVGLRPEPRVLEVVHADWQEAERKWIAELRKKGAQLLNHTSGGEGRPNYAHTQESRAKMSASQRLRYATTPSPLKGRRRPQEVIEKMSTSQRGRVISQTHRQKIADSLRGKSYLTPEGRAKIIETNKNRTYHPLTEEQRRKISERATGREQSEEARAKKSAALKGVPKSDEHRRKLSEAAYRRYAKAREVAA